MQDALAQQGESDLGGGVSGEEPGRVVFRSAEAPWGYRPLTWRVAENGRWNS